MTTQALDHLKHEHVYLGRDHDRNARRTMWVVAITAAMMVAEIIAGTVYGSMAPWLCWPTDSTWRPMPAR